LPFAIVALASAMASALASAMAAPARSAPTKACADRVSLLERRLSAAVDEEYDLKRLHVDVRLPRVEARAIGNDTGSVIELLPEGPSLNGTPLHGRTEAEWRADIDARYAAGASKRGGKPPSWVYVLADQATDVRRSLKFLVGFGADHELQLVVEPPTNPLQDLLPKAPPAGAQRLVARLAKLEDTPANAGARAKLFANELAIAGGSCKPLYRIFDLRTIPMPARSRQFVQVVVESVRDCQCTDMDVDALEYAALRMYTAFQYPRRVLRVQFSRDGIPLRLGDGPLTAQSLAQAISAAGGASTENVLRLRPPAH
jgi:hypothetical protein